MKNIDVVLDENIKTYLERLSYEETALKEILITLIEYHQNDTSFLNAPLFLEYLEKYEKRYIELLMLREEILKTYTPQDIKGVSYGWEIYPYDGILRFKVYDVKE